jgi:hypothetical protein
VAQDRARILFLTHCSRPTSPKNYTYSGLSEQVAKAVGSATTTYAFTPGGSPLGEATAGTAKLYLADPHGDIVGLVSTAAANQATTSFDPFGQTTTAATGSLLGYQGDLTDPLTKQVDTGPCRRPRYEMIRAVEARWKRKVQKGDTSMERVELLDGL